MQSESIHLRAGEFRGTVGVARRDITPPVGIYARCWGAATHDVAEAIHRPLTLTTIAFEHSGSNDPLVLMSADLMSWRSRASEDAVIGEILRRTNLPRQNLMFCLTHTHSAPGIRTEDAAKPGGHLIEPFQKQIVASAIESIEEAKGTRTKATLTWRYGKCDLAANRDLSDPRGDRIVCGFNPDVPADDTLLVGRICDPRGKILGTIVNYACHPTTLGWENRLLSPDWVGAMRQTIENETGAPCAFLQGASGELAPAEQYVADTRVADRQGRRVGFAALAALHAMHSPGQALCYDRVVESGAPLAVWRHRSVEVSTKIAAHQIEVELPLKPMPVFYESDHPVMKERIARQLAVRSIVGTGTSAKMPLWVWKLGDAILVGQPNEAYSVLQTELRRHFSPRPIAVMNLVNGSAGYLAPREMYEREVYQVWQSPFAAGSLEIVIDSARDAVEASLSQGQQS